MANTNTPFKELPDNILFNYNDFKEGIVSSDTKLYDPKTQNIVNSTNTPINSTHIRTVKSSSIKRRLTRDRLGFSL